MRKGSNDDVEKNTYIFFQQLTGREREVAKLISESKTNHEISYELIISKKTVEKHITSIYKKFEVDSRVAVTRILIMCNLIEV